MGWPPGTATPMERSTSAARTCRASSPSPGRSGSRRGRRGPVPCRARAAGRGLDGVARRRDRHGTRAEQRRPEHPHPDAEPGLRHQRRTQRPRPQVRLGVRRWITVTAHGKLAGIDIDPGDGSAPLTCTATELAATQRALEGPGICSVTWERTSTDQPRGTYPLTVTTHWEITWSGGGEAGVITFDLTNTRPVAVRDRKVNLVP